MLVDSLSAGNMFAHRFATASKLLNSPTDSRALVNQFARALCGLELWMDPLCPSAVACRNTATHYMKSKLLKILLTSIAFVVVTNRADEIIDWNQHLLESALTAKSSPLLTTRIGAIVQAAVFDAVNGIERKYEPIHVAPNAAAGASPRAAAAQAAYTALVGLFPAQKTDLDAKLAASLNGIASGNARENSVSIARGIDWGKKVGADILAWRAADGITPAPPGYFGTSGVGEWRATPPGLLAAAAPQFSTMETWVLDTQSQFRPAGPPALNSPQYTADYEEVRSKGAINSVTRSDDETTDRKS